MEMTSLILPKTDPLVGPRKAGFVDRENRLTRPRPIFPLWGQLFAGADPIKLTVERHPLILGPMIFRLLGILLLERRRIKHIDAVTSKWFRYLPISVY